MAYKGMRLVFVLALVFMTKICFPEDAPASFEERHSDKSYIFLLVEDEVKVNADWSFTRKIHRKVKIQKDDAMDMGEIPLPYDKKYDRIIAQEGFTITPDGKKHPVVKFQDIARYNGEPMYSDSMVRVLSMPAVGVGSIIEVSHTIASKGLPMKNAFWDIQSLRQSTPVKEFRYTITFPKRLGIRYREFGLTKKPVVEEKNGLITYRWALNDLYNEDQNEKYTPPPSPNDPMEAFEFSSVPSWDEFARWYSGLIDKNTRLTPEIEALAKSLVGDKQLVYDKVRAILEYIQDNFRYVSMSFGANAFEPHPTEEVFSNKYGDCKDLSLLARAMLKAVGVRSRLALFNTEDSINDPSYDLPIPTLFDHALLLVEDPLAGDFYADPLLKGYDIGQYPMNFQKGYTFVVDAGKGEFGRLPEFDAERDGDRSDAVIDIAEDGSGIFEISSVIPLDDSISMRDKWKGMNEKEKTEFFAQLEFTLANGGEVLERQIEGLDKRYGRIRSRIKYRGLDEFPSSDGLIVIDLNSIDRDGAFERKDPRKEGFFFSQNGILENETIYRIPAGFSLLYLPSDLNMVGPYFTFTRTIRKTLLGVTVKESLKKKRVLLPKESLAELKSFWADLSRKTRQRIVLRKIRK
ncbi:MAG: DUF3857 domain-containing protein [Candidatus Omnitrophica bacterium]|nr:DUF3857 domain-containing protein [Candidatus Omnitrophota bacterium]